MPVQEKRVKAGCFPYQALRIMRTLTSVGQKTGTSMRLCASQWLLIAVVILLGVSSMLSGCGKKGPLYLPDEPARQADSGVKKQ